MQVVLHDITDAAQLDRLRDDFFAAAAHSLQTPVAIIKANAEVASVGNAAMTSESLAAIKRQCDRIDLLLQNLFLAADAMGLGAWIHATISPPVLVGDPKFSRSYGRMLGFDVEVPRWRIMAIASSSSSVPCSIESTPARIACLMPSVPWAWAATLLP